MDDEQDRLKPEQSSPPERKPWVRPRLFRIGPVQRLTEAKSYSPIEATTPYTYYGPTS